MDTIAHRREHLSVRILSVAAAVSAASVTVVSYQGIAASYSTLFCVGLLGLVGLSALAYLRPVVTVVIALVFMTSPISLLLSLQQSALVSAFLLVGATIGLAMRTSFRSLTPDPMLLPLGTFAVYGVLSAAYGLWLGNKPAYVWGDCFQVIEFVLVYFLVAQLLTDYATIWLALRFWLISVLLTILMELLLFALGPNAGDLLPSWEGDAVSQELVRTIDINATILFAVLVNLYPVIRSRKQRFWIWLTLLLTLANIALSLSRGLWICTLIATLVSLVLQSGKARTRLLKEVVIVSLGIVFFAGAWKIGSDSDGTLLNVFEERVSHGADQVEEGFAGSESMATRRFLEMVIVGPQVLAQPWIGHGLGATYVIGGFTVLDSGTTAPIDHHFIHNLYLGTAFRMGLVGLALLFWIAGRYLRRIWKAYRDMAVDCNKALVIGLLASVVGQLFLSNTQPTIIDHPTCALIACAMALSVRLPLATMERDKQSQLNNGV